MLPTLNHLFYVKVFNLFYPKIIKHGGKLDNIVIKYAYINYTFIN